MIQRFNPNTNPYVEDLLGLEALPNSRFSQNERRLIGAIIVGKIYGLTLVPINFYDGYSRMLHRSGNNDQIVNVIVLFGSDRDKWKHQLFYRNRSLENRVLIVLGVTEDRAVELYNGRWEHRPYPDLFAAITEIYDGRREPPIDDKYRIAALSDEEAQQNYSGNGGGNDRRDGGGDGGGGGNNAGGDDGNAGGSGAGGITEVLTHPVLFSVDRTVFDNILAQT